MYRGKVTAVDAKGVYVQTAEFGVLGPCQAVVANYAVGDMVLCDNVGDEAAPDLIVVGKLTALGGNVATDASGNLTQTSTGSVYHYINSVAGSHRGLRIRSAGVDRWIVRVNSTAETGSNVGSNFEIYAFSDAGSSLGAFLTLWRSTGRLTLTNVGTTGGIELGSSGPTITSGSGAPSHTPPNGSIYLRTDGTASTTLYVRAGGSWTALT